MKPKTINVLHCTHLQARAQLEDLQRYAEDAQLEGQRTEIVLRPGPTFKKTGLATHIMLWSAVFFTSAFHSSLPSLQQKLLASIITPVRRNGRLVARCVPQGCPFVMAHNHNWSAGCASVLSGPDNDAAFIEHGKRNKFQRQNTTFRRVPQVLA